MREHNDGTGEVTEGWSVQRKDRFFGDGAPKTDGGRMHIQVVTEGSKLETEEGI